MNKHLIFFTISFILLGYQSCSNTGNKSASDFKPGSTDSGYAKGTFGYDINFLKQYHKYLLLLGDSAGAITL